MSRKVKYSIEEKLNAVQNYLDGKESMYSIANRFGIDVSSVSLWVNKYKAMGVDAFSTNQNKHYTKEEKEQAIAAYLHGEGSLMSICKNEYSCAMKSHFRKFGNQMSGSGNHLCNYASLLA